MPQLKYSKKITWRKRVNLKQKMANLYFIKMRISILLKKNGAKYLKKFFPYKVKSVEIMLEI